MIKAKHIATTLILVAIMLLAGLRYASAQENTSAQPYFGSTHLYRVAMGDFNNTVTWQLSNPSPIITISAPQTWIASGKKDLDTDSAWIEITFVSTVFDNVYTDPWTLTYNEMSASTGSCVAVRTMEITPVSNTFYLTLGVDAEICNTLSDSVLNWDNIDGLGLGHSGTSTNMPTYVDFTIQMNKAATFVLNTWVFRGTIKRLDGNYSLVNVRSTTGALTGTSSGGGSFTITDNGNGTFDVVVNTPTDANALSDNIVVRANITGLVYKGERVQLDVSGGEAHSGSVNYGVVTTDNLLLPSAPGDRQQLQTISPLPATPNITLVD